MDLLRSTYVGAAPGLRSSTATVPLTFNHSYALEWWQFVPVNALFVPNICRLYLGGGDRSPLEARSIEFWTFFFGETEDTLLRMSGSLRVSVPGNQHLGETILRGNSGEAQSGGRQARLRGVVVGSNGARFCLPTPAARARFL